MVFDLISSSSSTSLANSSTNDRVFSTLDHHHHPMFHSSESKTNTSSTIEPPLSDERDLTQIENAQKQQQQQQQPGKWKMLSKRRQSCTNDLYAIAASRYHRFKPSLTVQPTPTPITTTTILATPPSSTSDEMHPASNDEFKFYPASISSRRSTTDCNDLLTLHHSRRLGNMETNNSNLLTIVDEESRDSMWPSTDDHHLLVPTSVPETPSLTRFYSDPSITPISPTSSSSASSFNLHSNSTDLSLSSQYSSSISFFNDLPDTNKILSSSSGYESNVPTSNSSLNSISDHLFLPSPDSIMMPPPATPPSLSTTKPKAKNKLNVMDSTHPKNDRNLVEQFIDLHLQKQNSFDQDAAYSPPSSFSSSSSSFHSQAALSTMNSPVCCRKCANHDDQQQLSSDTEDDSQSTTISTNLLPLQQQNKRPRSLPIAIQQPKGVNIDDTTEDEDDDDLEKTSSRDNSLTCHCPMVSSRKKRFRTCDLSNGAATAPLFSAVTSANGLFSDNNLISTAADKLHIDYKDIDDSNSSEHSPIKSTKNSLEHFIMSPTDKVKVQMKYPLTNNDRESDTQSNELKISQPEDIDFKRSKQKAIRVLYQNRLHLNSIQSPVTRQHNSVALPMRTATPGHGDSPLAKRTSTNPRLLRSVLSCSVFEADDEHEVVSSTPIGNPTGINGTRAKSHLETFNFLRGNFTESLLHGKILPCGILDGFTVKLGASGLFMPKQVVLPVTTFWFNVSEHQSASPYLGFVNLQCLPKRGYHTPTKGTITIALLNPNGTAVHLFLIIYDLSDMPPDHRTFIRQRIVLMPETTTGESQHDSRTSSKGNLRYLAHIRFVTSQTGKLYMHSDIRLIFARNKLDSDDRTATGKSQLVTLTDVPTPKYWSRK